MALLETSYPTTERPEQSNIAKTQEYDVKKDTMKKI